MEITIVQHSTTGKFHYADASGILDLGATLPGAVRKLRMLGVEPTHWLSKDNFFDKIPEAIK